MKKLVLRKLRFLCIAVVLFVGCDSDFLWRLSIYSDSQILAMADEEYDAFLKEHPPVKTTDPAPLGDQAKLVKQVGKDIADAAKIWLESDSEKPKGIDANSIKNFQWEYELVNDTTVNAWCMPGGKIVVYTGILPVTENADGLAIVMGHEVCHAIFNHGKKRMTASFWQQLGGAVLGMFTDSQLIMAAYGLGTNLGLMLPFGRDNESESDHYGLILAAVAGYDPEEAPKFWERMAKKSGGAGNKVTEFFSTHPSHATRINDLKGWKQEAKDTAAKLNPKPIGKE